MNAITNKSHAPNLKTITIIQLSIATVISLIFQFLLPFSWQPLDRFLHGIKLNGDPGTNLVIFPISQWYFSLSLSWLIYRDNPFVNNFLFYSIVPLGMIVFYEFFALFLFYDYIHITPLVIDLYLIWKKRDTLYWKYLLCVIVVNTAWLFSVYFMKSAYYREDFFIFLRNYVIFLISWIILLFLFKKMERIIAFN